MTGYAAEARQVQLMRHHNGLPSTFVLLGDGLKTALPSGRWSRSHPRADEFGFKDVRAQHRSVGLLSYAIPRGGCEPAHSTRPGLLLAERHDG